MNFRAIYINNFSILSIILLVSIDKTLSNEDICSDVPKETIRSHFATKTAYDVVQKESDCEEKFHQEVSGNTCQGQPVQLWLITRHGTRYPNKKVFDTISAMLPLIAEELVFNFNEGRGCLSESQASELTKWSPPYSARDVNQLQETGADEQFSLGQYWRQLYSDLLSVPYSVDDYKVETTVHNRTTQSAYHFLRGFFGDEEAATIRIPRPRTPNWKLRAHEHCPAWKEQILNNRATLEQQRLFEQSPDVQQMLVRVSQRMGYDQQQLTFEEVRLVYEECRFESAWWQHRQSVWCAVMSAEDIEIMEYHQALKYYYMDSYGGPELARQVACASVVDLYKHINAAVSGKTPSPRALLYFSHDTHMVALMSLLGLSRPTQHLRHDNRAQWQGGFNISAIAPFSTNLAFVLYKCGESGGQHSYRVGGLLQGVPVSLASLCPHEGSVTCLWPPELVRHTAEHCRVKELCAVHDEL